MKTDEAAWAAVLAIAILAALIAWSRPHFSDPAAAIHLACHRLSLV